MRKFISPLVLAATLHAGEQVIQVTPQSLDGWTATGAPLATVA